MSSFKIEKLNDNNYHSWKQKIFHLLVLKDLDGHIEGNRPVREADQPSWDASDAKAQAFIALTLSDQLLENVRDVKSCKEMWESIRDVFERHTLLNKLSARRKFYTACKSEDETILQFANRIRHLGSTLKSMNVIINENEMAMAFLNGLPDPYDSLISALDAVGNEESKLEFDHVKSRVMQEEQRMGMRIAAASSKAESAALLSQIQKRDGTCANCKTRPTCQHCNKKGHTEDKCWKKHPHLNPHSAKSSTTNQPALIVTNDEADVVCLLGRHRSVKSTTNLHEWIIDSGCSNHVTFNKASFSSLIDLDSKIELADGNVVQIVGQGTVELNIIVDGIPKICQLENVFLAPELGFQLLSVSQLDNKGLTTSFSNGKCQIRNRQHLMATGSAAGKLYVLDTPSTSLKGHKSLVSNSLSVWHERMAHVSHSTIQSMVQNKVVTGVEIESTDNSDPPCDGCVIGKGHREPIPKSVKFKSTTLLQLVHSDLNGPLEVPSLGGSKYFVTFIDDFSKWTVVYMMRNKSETFERFKQYHAYSQLHTGHTVSHLNVIHRSSKTKDQLKALRTDNGGEYLSNEFKDYLLACGISHQLTVAYTPQQNGVAERMNRTIMDLVRSMIHTAGIDKKFWAEAVQTAVYVRNRVTSRSLPKLKTPFHLWHNAVPDLSHLRIFGSPCFYTIPKNKRKKLNPRSREAIFMGYSMQSKGYKIWDPESRKMLVSRDVIFRERNFPEVDEIAVDVEDNHVINRGGDSTDPINDMESSHDDEESHSSESSQHNYHEAINDNTHFPWEVPKDQSDVSEPEKSSSSVQPSSSSTVRRSNRKSNKPKRYHDSLLSLFAHSVPSSYRSATISEEYSFWKSGIDREHDCLMRNKTWTLVKKYDGIHVLPCKYIFRVKNGAPKVRLVVLGCKQLYGIDYNQTFAPVVKFTTIRLLLALVAAFDLECEQMDVVTAFLNGDLEEDIYMQIPEGLRTAENQELVCKLNKALYGLKQAPRQWYAKIHFYLVNVLEFKSNEHDPCLYIRKTGSSIIIIALYVDDLLIIGNSKTQIAQLKGEFKNRFEMKDLGPATVMLGIQITRDRQNKKLSISQAEYTNYILTRFGMEQSKPISTPMDKNCMKQLENSADDSPIEAPYREVIGCLIYLVTCTRPDISFAVSKLSQYLQNPKQCHLIAAKRILRYISGTRTHGVCYNGLQDFEVTGFSDSDYAGDLKSRKSTGGYVFKVCGGSISWKSKKQSCVATSTCEAEYMALCSATKEAVWLSRLVSTIQSKKITDPISIGVDNSGTISLSQNTAINERSKHIDVQFHYIRESLELGKVKVWHCRTDEQIADSLTKPLDRVKHNKFTLLQGIIKTQF